VACTACSLVNEPRVAIAGPSGVGYTIPSEPSTLSVTTHEASGSNSASGSLWLKNFGNGRATTRLVPCSTIRPRQVRVTGFHTRSYWAFSV
jgi:hypothetical protein